MRLPNFPRNSLPKILTREALEELYSKKKYRAAQIAEILKVKNHNVVVYLRQYGIAKVERWQRYGLDKFTPQQKEYLYGSLLGDDCLHYSSDNKYPLLQVIHSSKFAEYVKWKYGIWKAIVPGGVKKVFVKLGEKKFLTHRFYTAAHPEFLQFFKLYKNRQKQISREWLDHLTPLSLAVWYMDDGYFKARRNRMHFLTFAFGNTGNELIQKYFSEKWSLAANMGYSRRNKRGKRRFIWFNTENSIKLTKIIGSYLIPRFSYKINLSRELMWQKIPIQEKDYIKTYYNIKSPKLIAHDLGRSLASIHDAAYKLGLTQPRGGIKIYAQTLDGA